jgi:hypothetical protein
MSDIPTYEIDDGRSFSENMGTLYKLLAQMDVSLGPPLANELKLLEGGAALEREKALERLFASLKGDSK